MKKLTVRNLVLSGLFLALGLILPSFTGQIPQIGRMLLPMHIPVLLCGFVCGWPAGLLVGFITPILRSLLFTMPPMFPTAVAMAFELAAYGLLTGMLYKLLPKKNLFVYLNLLLSMIGGRIIWGIASYFIYMFGQNPFTFELFLGGAFINAVPGIILQIVLIPVLIIALKRARLMGDEIKG
jgi:thiamine transporter ThiT